MFASPKVNYNKRTVSDITNSFKFKEPALTIR